MIKIEMKEKKMDLKRLDNEALIFAYLFFCEQGTGKERMLEEIMRRKLLVITQESYSRVTGYAINVIRERLREREKRDI